MGGKGYIRLIDELGRTIAATQDWQTVPGGNDYIIYSKGGKVFVKNDREGEVEYSTEDFSSALAYALEDEETRIIKILRGEYIAKSKIPLKAGVKIYAEGGREYNENEPLVIVRLDDNFSDTVLFEINGIKNVTLEGFELDGNGKVVTAIKISSSGAVKIRKMSIRHFNNAIEIDETKTSLIEENDIGYNSGVGIKSLGGFADSIIIKNYIHANKTGIYMGGGSNDNIIAFNKIEWNGVDLVSRTPGMNIYGSKNELVIGNIFDRNSGTGVKVAGNSENIIIVGNQFRRNGRDVTGTSSNHIHLGTCSDVVIVGNKGKHGKDDNGSGPDTPEYAILYNGASNVIEVANDWNEAFTTAAVSYTSVTELRSLGSLGDNQHVVPTSAPSNPVAGSMYFNPATGTLHIYDGSEWKSVTLG